VLTGRVNPSGRLPFSIPVKLEDCAAHCFGAEAYPGDGKTVVYKEDVLVGYRWHDTKHIAPRFPFGHGLSYTAFAYSDLSIDKEEVGPFEELRVSMKLKNTGSVAGTEIVQLYLRDVHASMTRPVKELQGFARVALQPGEQKTVRFTVAPSQMAFVDEDGKWKIEKGEIEVQLGSSSEDIRLQGSYFVTKDAWLEGRDSAFYAKAEIK
jgi:beta-glucosidase